MEDNVCLYYNNLTKVRPLFTLSPLCDGLTLVRLVLQWQIRVHVHHKSKEHGSVLRQHRLIRHSKRSYHFGKSVASLQHHLSSGRIHAFCIA